MNPTTDPLTDDAPPAPLDMPVRIRTYRHADWQEHEWAFAVQAPGDTGWRVFRANPDAGHTGPWACWYPEDRSVTGPGWVDAHVQLPREHRDRDTGRVVTTVAVTTTPAELLAAYMRDTWEAHLMPTPWGQRLAELLGADGYEIRGRTDYALPPGLCIYADGTWTPDPATAARLADLEAENARHRAAQLAPPPADDEAPASVWPGDPEDSCRG